MTHTQQILGKLTSGMTVRELIRELKECDQDAKVVFACNYGDYHQTQQCLTVQGIDEMDTTDMCESAYSHSGVALSRNDDYAEMEEDDYDESETVVVLS